jgi:hypothetical protein
VPHAYPRRCEDYTPKPTPRAFSEREFSEALDNLWRIWRGLDADAMTGFKQLLAQYLAGGFSQREWADVVRSIGERGTLSPERSEGERHAADG